MFLPFSLKFTRVLSGAVLLSALALTGCSSSDNNNASDPVPGVDPVGFYTAMTEINGEMYPVNPNQVDPQNSSNIQDDNYAIAYNDILVIGTGNLQSREEDKESLLYVFDYVTEGNEMNGTGRLYQNGIVQPELYTLDADVMLQTSITGSVTSQDSSVTDRNITQFTLTYSTENAKANMPDRIIKTKLSVDGPGQLSTIDRWQPNSQNLNFDNLTYTVNESYEIVDSISNTVRPFIDSDPQIIDLDFTCSIYGREDFDEMRDLPISRFEPVTDQNLFTSTLVLDTCERVDGQDEPLIMQGLASIIDIPNRGRQDGADNFKVYFFWNDNFGSYTILEDQDR